MFKGSIVALATPMQEDGALDETAFEALINWQIESGTMGLVPVGTTGESPTLTHAEHRRLIDITVRVAKGRVPVIAGTGSNSTAEAIETTRHAKESGADAALVVTPYYNKPTQDGLFRHYSAIADAVDIPIVIYNIPGRSVIEMSVETMAALAKHPNIVGVKDSTANLLRPLQTRRMIGAEFCQLSGEDGTAIAFNAAGGVGCISVTANVAPALCAQMQNAWLAGDAPTAMAIQQRLLPLHDALFVESNPAPVKYALSLLGRSGAFCRLPLAPLKQGTKDIVQAALAEIGLLG
ncbi:4-hydroxy-tetrahydrodipicolinate synthase [Acetobacteraceae bacterium KSS8]|uniref:4-hydroxy-tetrahydrodipicolinate synthase n=1 Tax=Endosaccharibacter trunci TaxID=2812733 RepID=A0ABT1W4Y5_9PROT|nr:4-hydroxy-tetrahydrodipicolinate synthase [Acetobacteraceae bacterium KSS8]